jgi:hypothetical protein
MEGWRGALGTHSITLLPDIFSLLPEVLQLVLSIEGIGSVETLMHVQDLPNHWQRFWLLFVDATRPTTRSATQGP